jgi:hypothetical protein
MTTGTLPAGGFDAYACVSFRNSLKFMVVERLNSARETCVQGNADCGSYSIVAGFSQIRFLGHVYSRDDG